MTYSKGERSLLPPKQADAKVGEGVQYRRCKPNVEPWRPGGRRPGHPRHRTVRHHRRPVEDRPPPGTLAPGGRDHAQAVGRRTGHPGGHAGAAGLPLRSPLAALRPHPPWPPVPYLPKQPGYNKRLRAAAALLQWVIRALASDTTFWTDDVTTCGWPTPPRWSAAARARPPSARSWPAGPSTATAPATRATFGGCGCTWSAPCTACRSASP